MRRRVLELQKSFVRRLAIPGLVVLISVGSAAPSFAQSGDNHAQDQGKQAPANPADASKENQRKIDEFVEAAQAINGPAGNPECVWLGRRVVQLMFRDDLDTAFRHLDLYDRFGCPGGHVQAAFRCLTRFFAQIDDKVPNSLSNHVQACWINPNAQPQAAAAPPSSQPSTTAGSAAPAPASSPQPTASPQPAAK
ncbi:hypothetical protein [Bradyrhizobium sp. Tv2a-2]|uniref:hypothetical protein n=1 Tax=Bradyrhizobium sp. Tv2a-2 TaxID=113395 RepID=UPI0003FFEF66|nr:hypothetical protein [Bradyrhizobium sp. Tv2a-2]